jgi:hypothetical protein
MNKYSYRSLIKRSQDGYERDNEGYIVIEEGNHEFRDENVKVYNNAEVTVYGSSKVEVHDSSKVYVYSDLVEVTDKSNGRAKIVDMLDV